MQKTGINLDQALNPWLAGSGEYPFGRTFEYLMETYGFKREEILRLAGNESTLGTSPKAIAAAKEAAESSNFYDEPKAESLIKALEEKFKADGIDMSELGIVVGNGMDSMIEHSFQLFTNETRSIIDISPTFSYYKFAAKRRGVEVVDAPRILKDGNYKVDPSTVLNAIKENTKLVFLCTPNNPDGSIVELDDIEKIAEALFERNIMLFVDHAYIDFTDRERYDARKIINKYPNMIIGYTFSKAYALAGFRVGYALMSKELQAKFLSTLGPFLCTRPSIAAAKAALADQGHLNKIIKNNLEQRPEFINKIKELGYEVFNSQTNFVLFKSKEDILEKLMSKGIIIRAIPEIEGFGLRVTVGTSEECERFIAALTSLRA